MDIEIHTNNQIDKSDQKCNSSGGPSILAGPKAFAQMTGLGSDGRPHVNNNNNVPVCKFFFVSNTFTDNFK